MTKPLTRILMKIFAAGFYRVNAGLIASTFLGAGVYFFFINVLNQTHLPPEEIILHKLTFVLTLLNSPLIAVLIAVAWFFYTLRSWRYVTAQYRLPQHQFLQYSSTAMSLARQRFSWGIVQTLIHAPLIFFALFALVTGITFSLPLIIPALLLAYLAILTIISAYRYTAQMNQPEKTGQASALFRFTRGWKKPYACLFLYELIYNRKITLIVTRLLSAVLIATETFLFTDDADDNRTAFITMLTIALVHSVTLYQSYCFENTRGAFARGFPYSKIRRYANLVAEYCILTLPEFIWIILYYNASAPVLLLLNTSIAMMFRCMVYNTGPDMQKFLLRTLLVFIGSFVFILFSMPWLLTALMFTLSLIVFVRYYDRQDHFIHQTI